MNRIAMINYVTKEIIPQIDRRWSRLEVATLGDIVQMVSKWRIGKHVNVRMIATVDDGVLSINGEPVGRIAPKTPKVAYSAGAGYWEGRILARQEM